MTSTIALGLHPYHGAPARSLKRDGALIAAAEEERFRRIKHWAGFPAQAIRYCLDEAGASARDITHVALNQNSHAHRLKKLAYVLSGGPSLRLLVNKILNRRKRTRLEHEIATAFGEPWRGT